MIDIPSIYNNIGYIRFSEQKYDLARNSYEKAYHIFDSLNNTYGRITSYNVCYTKLLRCIVYMLRKLFKIEFSFGSKWIFDIWIKINCKQSAWIVRTQRNFSARICRNGSIAKICVTVCYRFADNSIPEKNSRFCRFPCIMNNLFPDFIRINFFNKFRSFIVNRVLSYNFV